MRISVLISIIILISCNIKKGRSFLPYVPGYNENKKEVSLLPKKLREISGMFYQSNGKIATMNDEAGKIFILDPTTDSIETIEYGAKADYEDITMVDNNYYVLESNGNLHRVSADSGHAYEKYVFTKIKKTEFESLYYDKAANKLILIAKDHKHKVEAVLAYSFDLGTDTFSDSLYFSIPMQKIRFILKDNLAECKPSAASIHPRLNKLFIIASIGKVLLECDLNGKLERAFKINPLQFPQPEGITFAPNGDMYISNEAGQDKATILKFPYIQP